MSVGVLLTLIMPFYNCIEIFMDCMENPEQTAFLLNNTGYFYFLVFAVYFIHLYYYVTPFLLVLGLYLFIDIIFVVQYRITVILCFMDYVLYIHSC